MLKLILMETVCRWLNKEVISNGLIQQYWGYAKGNVIIPSTPSIIPYETNTNQLIIDCQVLERKEASAPLFVWSAG